jgi:hypothetical protein
VETQTAFRFCAPDHVEPLTGDRTRVVRIRVKRWDLVSRDVRRELKVTVGTFKRREGSAITSRTRMLHWSAMGECVVVDGGGTHAQVRATLMQHGVEFAERADAGRWCVVGKVVLLRCAEIGDGATAGDILTVGMPVLALRGDTWARWRGAPRLWPYDRALIAQIARRA